MAAPTTNDELTSVQWRSVEWVQAFGALTAQTALDYFAQSPFFDATSNNAVLRMQTQFSVMPGSVFNEDEELKRFVGIEFAVTHGEPPNLFVIEKRDRISPTEARTIAAYWILYNSIYQAPDLYSVLSNRLLSSLFYMQTALSAARNNRSDFAPRTGGNAYRVVKKDAEVAALATQLGTGEGDKPTVTPDKAKDTASNAKSAINMDFLLARALQTTMQLRNTT